MTKPRSYSILSNLSLEIGSKEYRTLSGHEGFVAAVVFSPNGRHLITAGWDSLRIWNPQTGELEISSPWQLLASIAFSARSNSLAIGDWGGTSYLLNLNDGSLTWEFGDHNGTVKIIAISPNEDTVVSGSSDKTIRVFHFQSGALIKTLTSHTSSVNSVAFSPDGRHLASASDDKSIKLWNTQNWKLEATLERHTRPVNSIAFSPDGKFLASASDDRTVRLWDKQTSNQLQVLRGHTDKVNSVAFSPDSKFIASGSDDGFIRIWEVITGREIGALIGHSDSIWSVTFSPDGSTIASASKDRTVKLWDTQVAISQSIPPIHPGRIITAAFSPDGEFFVTGSSNKKLALWQTKTTARKRVLRGHRGDVRDLAIGIDNKTVVSGAVRFEKAVMSGQKVTFNRGELIVWNAKEGKLEAFLGPLENDIASVAISPDCNLVATGGRHCFTLFERDSQIVRKWFKTGYEYPGNAVAFSPDNKTLATGGDRIEVAGDHRGYRVLAHEVKLWDVNTGELLKILQPHDYEVSVITFSPDAKKLAGGCKDNMLRAWGASPGPIYLWNLETGEFFGKLEGHPGGITSMAFSWDGKLLASGGYDKTVKLWSITTGQLLTWIPCSDIVLAVSFSKDSQELRAVDAGSAIHAPGISIFKMIQPISFAVGDAT